MLNFAQTHYQCVLILHETPSDTMRMLTEQTGITET